METFLLVPWTIEPQWTTCLDEERSILQRKPDVWYTVSVLLVVVEYFQWTLHPNRSLLQTWVEIKISLEYQLKAKQGRYYEIILNYIDLYGMCTCPVLVFFDKFELNQTRTFTPATTSFTILLKLQPTVAYATIKCPFGSFLLIWKYHKTSIEKCVNIDSNHNSFPNFFIVYKMVLTLIASFMVATQIITNKTLQCLY